MPYMFTDLSKVRSELSEEKVQFLVYQMLCGLRVSGAAATAAADLAGSGVIGMIVANWIKFDLATQRQPRNGVMMELLPLIDYMIHYRRGSCAQIS